MLDQEREPGFDALSRIAAALPQEGILGGLLADRRSAADASAGCVALHRIFNGLVIEAMMRAELSVFRSDGCAHHVAVDLADRHPVTMRAAAGDQIADHGEGDG